MHFIYIYINIRRYRAEIAGNKDNWIEGYKYREKEMATHSSILAMEIPRTEEPGGLQSTGSQKSQT